MLRSRVAVRLKEHQQALEAAAARRFERGANLAGMVAVIVNQRNAAENALDLEAPADAREIRQALRESSPREH